MRDLRTLATMLGTAAALSLGNVAYAEEADSEEEVSERSHIPPLTMVEGGYLFNTLSDIVEEDSGDWFQGNRVDAYMRNLDIPIRSGHSLVLETEFLYMDLDRFVSDAEVPFDRESWVTESSVCIGYLDQREPRLMWSIGLLYNFDYRQLEESHTEYIYSEEFPGVLERTQEVIDHYEEGWRHTVGVRASMLMTLIDNLHITISPEATMGVDWDGGFVAEVGLWANIEYLRHFGFGATFNADFAFQFTRRDAEIELEFVPYARIIFGEHAPDLLIRVGVRISNDEEPIYNYGAALGKRF